MSNELVRNRSADLTLLAVAVTFGALEMLTYAVEPYELFHDELYY